MARIRTIKPGFFRSPDIAALPLSARLTFIGLWTYVDDEGKGADDARLVKGDLWQLDDKHTIKKVEADLVTLADHGLIQRYTAGQRHYLKVCSWSDHQKISHPTPSAIPEPLRSPQESLRQERKGKERKGGDDDAAPPEPSSSGDTSLSEEQVRLNVESVRSLRAGLHAVKDEVA